MVWVRSKFRYKDEAGGWTVVFGIIVTRNIKKNLDRNLKKISAVLSKRPEQILVWQQSW